MRELLACLAIALVGIAPLCAAPEGFRVLDVRDVGEYAAVPWGEPDAAIEPGTRADRVRDLTFAVSSINLQAASATSPEFIQRWRNAARWGRLQGKALLPRIYFWDGEDRYTGPMQDIEYYWARLDGFLSKMDISDFYGIVLAEENVHYAGRPAVLAELYRRVKAKYDVDVWQWWSPSTAVPGDGGWIPADGWVIDPYFKPRDDFRRYLRKYLITGLPVVVMPWASDELEVTDEQWAADDAQLDAAVEFNLPAAFYWVSGSTCYFDGARDATERPIDRINQRVWAYTDRVKAIPEDYTGAASTDLAQGQVLDIGPTEDNGDFVYADDFSTSRCIDHAWMTGFRDLVLDGKTLAARGFQGRRTSATLTYRFSGDLAVRYPQVRVSAETDPALNGQVEIAVSVDGEHWQATASSAGATGPLRANTIGRPDFAEVRAFWVRVRMTGDAGTTASPPCRIDDLQVRARVVPPVETTVYLREKPGTPGTLVCEETFQTRKYLVTTTCSGTETMEWTPGQLGVRLRPGGTQVSLVWRVKAPRPVQGIAVTLSGWANSGSLGTAHLLDLSTDGQTWMHEQTTRGREMDVNGWVREPLAIDAGGDPAFTRVTEFYVRARLVADAYHEVHPVVSGRLHGLRIEAAPIQ